MTAVITGETHVLFLALTGAVPDIPVGYHNRNVIPATVQLTYRRHVPDHDDNSDRSTWTVRAAVTGAVRKVNGGAGRVHQTVDYLPTDGRQRPQWLTELIKEYQPKHGTPDDADHEQVTCSSPNCRRSERFQDLTERGWRAGGIGTWQCPNCSAGDTA